MKGLRPLSPASSLVHGLALKARLRFYRRKSRLVHGTYKF